jgi:hypothetical protein
MVLVLIFAEALGLFGLIISLLMGNKEPSTCDWTAVPNTPAGGTPTPAPTAIPTKAPNFF